MSYLKLPIIPVPKIVFFPFTELPVYVVEKAYKKMVLDCVESRSPLGICLADETYSKSDGKTYYSPREVGTYGAIQILSHSHGTLKIVVKGLGRMRLRHLIKQSPYLLYECEVIDPCADVNNFESCSNLLRLKILMRRWAQLNMEDEHERDDFFSRLGSATEIINNMALHLVNDPEVQQILLELNLIREKIHLLSVLIDSNTFKERRHVGSILKKFEEDDFKMAVGH